MNFFQKLLPSYVPPLVASQGELTVLRERILQGIQLVFVALGVGSLIFAIQQPLLLILYSFFMLLLIINLSARNWPYLLRGHVITVTVYLLAVSELVESGQLGEVRMFLIIFVALTALLFSYKNVIMAIFVSLLTIAAAGILSDRAPDLLLPGLISIKTGTSWVQASFTFLILSAVLSGATTMLISGLESNLVKKNELTNRLEQERDALEKRIQERTESISRRLTQMLTAAEISHAMGSMQDVSENLLQIVELLRVRFSLYYVGVFMLDASGQQAVLKAGTGEAGLRMLTQGHRLSVGGSSMIGWTIANRKARIALDAGAEAVRFSNPHLPLTRSELALPILARERVLGAMTIQSVQSNDFDENDITMLQSIADNLGVALDNDRLYQETRQSLEEIRALNHEYLQQGWSEAQAVNGELTYSFENQKFSQDSQVGHSIQVPLTLRDEVIGYITLETDQPTLSADETHFVENITNQTAVALESARLLQETERRAIQEQKLNELTTHFSQALSVDEILQKAVQELGQLPAVAEVSVEIMPIQPSDNEASLPVRSLQDRVPPAASNGRNGKGHAL